MGEAWRSVPGYLGRYSVSSEGRVWAQTAGRMMKPHPQRHGYCTVSLSKDGKVSTAYVHRLVLEAFRGEAPSGRECSHLDGSRDNNRIDNLEWATRSENQQMRKVHGTASINRGEDSPGAILSEQDVLDIRVRLRAGDPIGTIAHDFNVGPSAIGGINRGRAWGWLGDPPSGGAFSPCKRAGARRGSDHHGSKLSVADVRAIREGAAQGQMHKELALQFGVCRQAIGDICTRRRWAWVDPQGVL